MRSPGDDYQEKLAAGILKALQSCSRSAWLWPMGNCRLRVDSNLVSNLLQLNSRITASQKGLILNTMINPESYNPQS